MITHKYKAIKILMSLCISILVAFQLTITAQASPINYTEIDVPIAIDIDNYTQNSNSQNSNTQTETTVLTIKELLNNCCISNTNILCQQINSIKVDGSIINQLKANKDAQIQAELQRIAEEQQRQQEAAAQAEAARIAAEQAAAVAVATPNMTYYGNCRITHYCNCSICCGKWAGGGTASGAWPTAGRTVANGDLPFGTKLLINGQVYIVEDRGVGAQQIDIFCDSHADACARGMYYTDVYIINN